METQVQIPIMDWNEIKANYKMTESKASKNLMRSNYSSNFWYPYDNSKFNEEETLLAARLFQDQYPDTSIKSMHNYKFLEIFLNTLEKHQFMYSIVTYIKANRE